MRAQFASASALRVDAARAKQDDTVGR